MLLLLLSNLLLKLLLEMLLPSMGLMLLKKTCSIKQVLLFWPNLMVSGCPERENLMFFQHFYLLCYLLQFENTRKN